MFGQLSELALPGAGVVDPVDPVDPDDPVAPVAAEDDALVVGVVVELVAAFAAMPPPITNAPDIANANAALWILRICTHLHLVWALLLTSSFKSAALGDPWEMCKSR
jgi:hypothetical protein